MTLRELEIFFTLSKTNHTAEVAKKLHISQSAVSLAIKSLEMKLGEKLFDRVGKHIILNERGKFFKNLTKPHFNALKEAAWTFKKDMLVGELKVAASRTIGDYIMPQIFFDFKKLYPAVYISNTTQNSKEIVEMVLKGEINLGFIESKIEDKNLYMQKLKSDELIVVTSDKSLKDKELYIDELSEKTWLLREEGSGTREIFLQEIAQNQKELKNRLVFSSFESIKRVLSQNSDAITCISSLCVQEEIKRGVFFEVRLKNFSFKRDFYMIHHKNKYKNRLFVEFTNFATKCFSNN